MTPRTLLSLFLSILFTSCQLLPTNPEPLPCNENSTDCFRCKIDGEWFFPNGSWKSTPLTTQMKDSNKHLVIYGSNGGKMVAIELKSNRPIEPGMYPLTSWPVSGGYYSPDVNHTFRTSPGNPGSLTITSLTAVINQVNQPVIAGAFSFTGLDSLSRKQVAITNGIFRVRYAKY